MQKPVLRGTHRIPVIAPLIDRSLQLCVRLFRLSVLPGYCSICGNPTLFVISSDNLRENVISPICRSFNRARQMHYAFSHNADNSGIRIWNMENTGSLHIKLLKQYGDDYISSAYFGEEIPSGQKINGILHEDVCRTSFRSDHFDIILSSDVLEHVPNPEQAFAELFRIMKRGGKFIFTVPFLENEESSQRRAVEDEVGNIVFLKEPHYHQDPLRLEGILVFTIFGWDLINMLDQAGLQCKAYRLYSICRGIIGTGTVAFVASKE